MKGNVGILATLLAQAGAVAAHALRVGRGTQPHPGAIAEAHFPEAVSNIVHKPVKKVEPVHKQAPVPDAVKKVAPVNKQAPVVAVGTAPAGTYHTLADLVVDKEAVELMRFLADGEDPLGDSVNETKVAETESGHHTAAVVTIAPDTTTSTTEAPSSTKSRLDRYMPACLRHVEGLMQRMDQSYTDVQMKTVLDSHCMHEQHFPESQEDSFHHSEACERLSNMLIDARHLNQEYGTIEGYHHFCAKYFEHKYGAPTEPPKKAEAPPPPKKDYTMLYVVLALAILGVVVVAGYVMVQRFC